MNLPANCFSTKRGTIAMKQLRLAIPVVFGFSVQTIVGATIYDTGPFTADAGAMASDFSTSTQLVTPMQRADDFVLQSASQITKVNWWGVYEGEATSEGL